MTFWVPAHVTFPEWPVLEWRRQAFGATIRFSANTDNWVHTPVAWNGHVHAVHFLYDARGTCRIQAVLVFSGDAILAHWGKSNPDDPLRPLEWGGNHLGQLDNQNGIEVDRDAPHGLGVSLAIHAGDADSEIFMTAIGADE